MVTRLEKVGLNLYQVMVPVLVFGGGGGVGVGAHIPVLLAALCLGHTRLSHHFSSPLCVHAAVCVLAVLAVLAVHRTAFC